MPPQPPGSQPPQPPAYPPAYPPGGQPPQPQQQPYPGAYQGQMPQGAYAAGYYAATPGYPGVPVTRRTGWLTFAQVIVIIEASLFLLIGIGVVALGVYVMTHGNDINTAFSNVSGYTPTSVNVAGGVFVGIGAVVAVIAILWLVLGVTLGRPSNVSRWIIVVFVVLAAVGDLASLANGRYTGSGVIGTLVLFGINALVLYALLIDPATRRAFAARTH